MFSTVRHYVYGAMAAIGAGLLLVLRIVTRQRDSAREKAEQERKSKKAAERNLERKRRVSDAQRKAREDAKNVAEKEADRVSDGRRPDSWGDGRLREKD